MAEIIKCDGSFLNKIKLKPKNKYEAVLQNVACIVDTIQNSCPMARDIGTPGDAYGRPISVVENELIGKIYDQIEEFEPRAILGGVRIESENDKMIPYITIEGVKDDE